MEDVLRNAIHGAFYKLISEGISLIGWQGLGIISLSTVGMLILHHFAKEVARKLAIPAICAVVGGVLVLGVVRKPEVQVVEKPVIKEVEKIVYVRTPPARDVVVEPVKPLVTRIKEAISETVMPSQPKPGDLITRRFADGSQQQVILGGIFPGGFMSDTPLPRKGAGELAKEAREYEQFKGRMVTAFDETKSIADWAQDFRCRVDESWLASRLDRNWAPEDALSNRRGSAEEEASMESTNKFLAHMKATRERIAENVKKAMAEDDRRQLDPSAPEPAPR